MLMEKRASLDKRAEIASVCFIQSHPGVAFMHFVYRVRAGSEAQVDCVKRKELV